MIISLDTETTGVDLAHGAVPFLITWCEPGAGPCFVEWPVDPLTRRPQVDQDDVAHVAELLDAADVVYLHNAKFDARALLRVGLELPWDKVRDTLVASHLLASNYRHGLEHCCVEYLGADITPHERLVKEVTQQCRTIAKLRFPDWRIAEEGLPEMPSVRASSDRDEDKPWKNDMWLPSALANHLVVTGEVHPEEVDERWLVACSRYACADSEHTAYLGLETDRRIRERGLWRIYEHRLQLVRADYEMEVYGITGRGDYTQAHILEYEEHVAEAGAALVAIAAEFGHDLELAAGSALNDNMRDFFYGAVHQHCPQCRYFRRVKHWNGEAPSAGPCPKCAARKRRPANIQLVTTSQPNLQLRPIPSRKNKSGNATLDGDAMTQYIQTLEDGPALDFVELLADKRTYDTALTYMRAYVRYGVPVPGYPNYYRIHSSVNPCGTDHLRQASNSPNMQNVSGESKEISNRGCFGPLPGREWWKMDFKQIEARIPAYESGEPLLVQLFDRPDEPPHWGSTYNLVASVFYPEQYAPCAARKDSFKREQPRLYKKSKFYWLARQYGAGRVKGDLLAGFEGASAMMEQSLPMLSALQRRYLDMAERLGYVETLPSRGIDPERGYPILASRTENGRVLSTTPFNYHVSGTACECKNLALVRCAERCRQWRAGGFDAWVAMEVHDELLFDFPRGATPEENLPRALELKALMEQSGTDLVPAMPTPVTVEYCAESWGEGVPV